MARIGIITCSNCTQELDCASVVCLGDMRKRKGLFQEYPPEEKLELVGITSCTGCPTINASQKILRKAGAIAEFRVDAIHFSYCLVTLCPFKEKYAKVIQEAYPGIKLVMGTHTPGDTKIFRDDVRDLLCTRRLNMTDLIKGRHKHVKGNEGKV